MSDILTLNQQAKLDKIREKFGETVARFDVEEQIRICSSLLAYFRDTVLAKDELNSGRKDPAIKNRREKKALIKSLIRVSSESVDHRNTVDFITVGALDKCLASGKEETGLSHEHMVPGEVIFEKLLGLPQGSDHLADLLRLWSFRALIKQDERTRLDSTCKLKSSLPANFPLGFDAAFYPFARYEAAKIFAGNLLPVSTRGAALLGRYMDVRRNFLDAQGTWGGLGSPHNQPGTASALCNDAGQGSTLQPA